LIRCDASSSFLRTQLPLYLLSLFLILLLPPRSTLFPYTTLFRSKDDPELIMYVSVTQPKTEDNETGATPVSYIFRNVLENSLNRSEEHTSELQSRFDLVCRLLLEKKKNRDIKQ